MCSFWANITTVWFFMMVFRLVEYTEESVGALVCLGYKKEAQKNGICLFLRGRLLPEVPRATARQKRRLGCEYAI